MSAERNATEQQGEVLALCGVRTFAQQVETPQDHCGSRFTLGSARMMRSFGASGCEVFFLKIFALRWNLLIGRGNIRRAK